MGKYDRLGAHLDEKKRMIKRYRFTDIERILGFELPPSARAHRAWWSNDINASQSKDGWLQWGWETMNVNIFDQIVTFHKVGHMDTSKDLVKGKLKKPKTPTESQLMSSTVMKRMFGRRPDGSCRAVPVDVMLVMPAQAASLRKSRRFIRVS